MRVCLFGVDGLTFRIVDMLLERGLLPNFQRLEERGVRGVLQSTVPPLTPPAWTSISTGLSTARHGVYDFRDFSYDARGTQPGLITHRRGGKAIWNILSEWGRRVIIANVPLTYPPEPVNGIMVSGTMTPGSATTFTYPESFKRELRQAIPDYQIDLNPDVSGDQRGDVFAETLKMTRGRLALLRLLLDKPWDFFYIVFVGADRIQHKRWEDIMRLHPQAVEYYQLLDKALGMVLEVLSPEDMLVIVSDHGFQGARRTFHIQKFLSEQGYLALNGGERRKAELVASMRKMLWASGLRGMPTHVRGILRRSGFLPVVKQSHVIQPQNIQWERTMAWVPSQSGHTAGYADIFLSDLLSEEQIASLRAVLQEVRDPENGQPLVAAFYREDAFGSGSLAPGERHLVVLSGEGTTISPTIAVKGLWSEHKEAAGIHHPDGVLYLYGSGARAGKRLAPAQVYDIVPTILSRMDLPIPLDLDGDVLEEAFVPRERSYAGERSRSVREILSNLHMEDVK